MERRAHALFSTWPDFRQAARVAQALLLFGFIAFVAVPLLWHGSAESRWAWTAMVEFCAIALALAVLRCAFVLERRTRQDT